MSHLRVDPCPKCQFSVHASCPISFVISPLPSEAAVHPSFIPPLLPSFLPPSLSSDTSNTGGCELMILLRSFHVAMTSSFQARLAYLLPLLPVFLPTILVRLNVRIILLVRFLLQCTLQSADHTSSIVLEILCFLSFLFQSTASAGCLCCPVFIYSVASSCHIKCMLTFQFTQSSEQWTLSPPLHCDKHLLQNV